VLVDKGVTGTLTGTLYAGGKSGCVSQVVHRACARAGMSVAVAIFPRVFLRRFGGDALCERRKGRAGPPGPGDSLAARTEFSWTRRLAISRFIGRPIPSLRNAEQ
jgi:hypothetical protein